MGAGAYLWLCLPEFGLPHFIMQVAVLELAIIWVYLAMGLAQAAIDGHLTLNAINRISLGTWVAGTAAIGLLLDKVEPLLHGSILFLAMVAMLLQFIYLVILWKRVRIFFERRGRMHVNSFILCATIAIQMCVLLELELFHRGIPVWIYQASILLGVIFYAVGFYGFLKNFLFVRTKSRNVCLSAKNTMLYSAAAVTGLAILVTGVFPVWLIYAVFLWATVVFVVVEAVEINRIVLSARKKGFIKMLCRYKHSDWLRIFSLSVFYAFGLSLGQGLMANWMVALMMYIGLYILTVLFLLECFISIYTLSKENSCLAVVKVKHAVP
jgi:hypothetical protein